MLPSCASAYLLDQIIVLSEK